MSILKVASYGAPLAIASLISIGSSQAAMLPVIDAGTPSVQYVDCAIGFHIGPAGACILGVRNDPPPPPPGVVIVDPPPPGVNDQGCQTKSVNRTDASGNSETQTKTDCN